MFRGDLVYFSGRFACFPIEESRPGRCAVAGFKEMNFKIENDDFHYAPAKAVNVVTSDEGG